MTRAELKTRIERLQDVPDKGFKEEFGEIWRALVSLFIVERRKTISERGMFIYYSPHEPDGGMKGGQDEKKHLQGTA